MPHPDLDMPSQHTFSNGATQSGYLFNLQTGEVLWDAGQGATASTLDLPPLSSKCEDRAPNITLNLPLC